MPSIFDLEKVSRYKNLQAERARLVGEIRGPKPRSFAGFLAGGIKSAISSGNKARKNKRGKKVYSYMQQLAKQNQW